MRYRLIVVYALVGSIIQASAASSEPFENAGDFRVFVSQSVAGISGNVLANRNAMILPDVVSYTFQPHGLLPGFQHILEADGGLLSDWGQVIWRRVSAQVRIWLNQGMTHAPVLVMGLAIVLLVPPLTVAGWFFRRLQPDPELTQRVSGAGRSESVSRISSVSGEETLGVQRANASDAKLEFFADGALGLPTVYPLRRGDLVVRIGREDDNEIQIRDKTVHRYHAAFDRQGEGGVAISDLSSRDGNGVTVNGKRVGRARLKDGDRIGLGAVFLTFRLDGK